MRFWDIALAIFIFNFSLALVGSLTDPDGSALFPGVSSYQVIKQEDWGKDKYQEVTETVNPGQGGEETGVNVFTIINFIINGFKAVINVILNATMGFPTMLKSEPFNLPSAITNMIGVIQSLIYAAGIIQFLTGREL